MRDFITPSGSRVDGHRVPQRLVYTELQRGESVVEKQVKEARTKCRSIASLLTDAPNPNSKGVLMFKKRRQRAKKYTLTCFGKAEGDAGTETEGETEEEGGSSFQSGSEVDEDGFSAAFDPTWDTGYLETLDRKSEACPSQTTPLANHGLAFDTSAYHQSPGFVNYDHQSPRSEYAGADGSAYPGLGTNGWYPPIGAGPNGHPAQMSPPALSVYNGGSVAVARASVVLSPPASAAPPHNHSEPHQNHYPANQNNYPANQNHYPPANPAVNPELCSNPGGSLNRTARPFTPGPTALSRSSVAPVLFRPPQPMSRTAAGAGATTATRPAAAVSMVNIPPTRTQSQPPPESRRSVSSASLYISPRNGNGGSSVYSPPMVHSPPASVAAHPPAHAYPPAEAAAQFSPPPPAAPQGPPVYPSSAQAFTPHPPPPPYSGMSAPQPPASYPPQPPASYPPQPPASYPPQPPASYPPQPPASYPPQPPAPASQVYAPAAQVYPPAPQVYVPAPQPPPQATGPPPPPQFFNPYAMPSPATLQQQPPFAAGVATTAPPLQAQAPPTADSLASREQRVSVPAARTGILAEARRRSNQKKPMFCSVQNKDVSPNPALLSMLQNIDDQEDDSVPVGPSFLALNGSSHGPAGPAATEAGGHESGPEEDWLRLGAEACNFMQARKGPKAPPVAPKPQHAAAPQAAAVPQLGGKGGQLFARRQSRMDRYMEERSPSAVPSYSPAQPRDASPTPSLPATWRYNSTCRAPPPINYNPLLSPSCPLKAQKTTQKAGPAARGAAPGGKGATKGKGKVGISAVDIMSHKPYQLNSSLFTYGGGVPQSAAPLQAPAMRTAPVREVRRFSTPPPVSTGPSLKVIAPRSATTLGEPMMWRSDDFAPPAAPAPYQAYQPPPQACSYQPQWGAAAAPLSPPHHPAPTGPLPQLPTFSSPAYHPGPPTFTHLQQQPDRQFKSSPDLSPLHAGPSRPVQSSVSQGGVPRGVPRPRFSVSNLGLQPGVWRPGSNMN